MLDAFTYFSLNSHSNPAKACDFIPVLQVKKLLIREVRICPKLHSVRELIFKFRIFHLNLPSRVALLMLFFLLGISQTLPGPASTSRTCAHHLSPILNATSF